MAFSPGSPSEVLTYDLGGEGVVTFTPEALDAGDFFNEDAGEYVTNVRGKFLLTPPAAVPEAATTVSFGLLLALGLGGVVVAARKKKSAASA